MRSVISLHTRSPFPVVKKSVGLTGLLRGAFIHSVFRPTEEPVLWMFLSGSEALVTWSGFYTWLCRAFPDHSDKWQVVCGLTEYLAQIRKYRIMGHHTKLWTSSPLEVPPSHSFKITLFLFYETRYPYSPGWPEAHYAVRTIHLSSAGTPATGCHVRFLWWGNWTQGFNCAGQAFASWAACSAFLMVCIFSDCTALRNAVCLLTVLLQHTLRGYFREHIEPCLGR